MASRNGIIPILAVNNIMDGNNPRGIPPTSNESIGFVFGHSLFNHTGQPSSTIWTSTGQWLGDIAAASGTDSAYKQQFGQLRDQTLPPNQGGLEGFPLNTYDPWPEPPPPIDFSTVGWTQILIMASNFEQVSLTPSAFVDESVPVLNYAVANGAGADIVIYEHWAEGAQYGLTIINGNDLSPTEYDIWKNLHTPQPSSGTANATAYHNWHVAYQDEMVTRGYNVKMVPIGPIMADLLINESYMSTVTHADLFLDDSPHGASSAYLLAALICYRAFYGQNPSPSYVPSTATPVVIPEILNNLSSIISYIETRLQYYNSNGVNVF